MNRAQMETHLTLKGWRPARSGRSWVGVSDGGTRLVHIAPEGYAAVDGSVATFTRDWYLLDATMGDQFAHLLCEWSDISQSDLRKIFWCINKELP